MKLKKILSLVLAGVMALSITGCVNQHPEETASANESGEVRLVATSPAVAQICNRLNLDYEKADVTFFENLEQLKEAGL